MLNYELCMKCHKQHLPPREWQVEDVDNYYTEFYEVEVIHKQQWACPKYDNWLNKHSEVPDGCFFAIEQLLKWSPTNASS